MTINKRKFRALIFWPTILLGLLLPIVTMAAVDLIKNAKAVDIVLKDIVAFYFHDYTDLVFLFWFFQTLVFVALAFLVKSKVEGKAGSSEPPALRYAEAIGAWALMVLFSVSVNIDVSISTSSTSAIAYIFIPFYEVVLILVGYAVGRIIGKAILWYDHRKKPA
jgi:hypothetical protein